MSWCGIKTVCHGTLKGCDDNVCSPLRDVLNNNHMGILSLALAITLIAAIGFAISYGLSQTGDYFVCQPNYWMLITQYAALTTVAAFVLWSLTVCVTTAANKCS